MSMAVAVVVLVAAASGQSGDVFDVTKFGAVGDGVTYDTNAVRAAAAALRARGGGELLFPMGRVFLTAPFNLSSHSVLTVAANSTVLCSARGEDYGLIEVLPWLPFSSAAAPGFWPQPCVYYDGSDHPGGHGGSNVTIQGPGTIDGQGKGWWACANDPVKAPCLTSPPYSPAIVSNRSNTLGGGRPHLILVRNVTDVTMRSIRTHNTPNWNIHFAWVTNLHVHHVHSLNDPGGPNADGLDIDAVQNALVEDCFFDVDDDALCVKSGRDYNGREFGRPARDIVFRNTYIGRGHGITVGSETSGSVYNVTFANITMNQTGTGIRMKSQRGRGGLVQGVTYRDIHMLDIVGACIQVTLNYHAGLAPTNATATPRFRDIVLENVRCERGGDSFWIDGLPESRIANLTLRNVSAAGRLGKCDFADCSCDALTTDCPPCCRAASRPRCTPGAELGCFAWATAAGRPPILPTAHPELHDRVTREDCAGACAAGKQSVAAILGGNHCFCGSPSDIAAAGSRKVPLAECSPSNCSMHYGDGCACTGNPAEHCGTPTHAIAYGFTCK